jgi:hypothetical protein
MTLGKTILSVLGFIVLLCIIGQQNKTQTHRSLHSNPEYTDHAVGYDWVNERRITDEDAKHLRKHPKNSSWISIDSFHKWEAIIRKRDHEIELRKQQLLISKNRTLGTILDNAIDEEVEERIEEHHNEHDHDRDDD